MRQTLQLLAKAGPFGLKAGHVGLSSRPATRLAPSSLRTTSSSPSFKTHPAPQPEPTQEAFALVRQILEERPRHFREILIAGVDRVRIERSETPAAEDEAAAEPAAQGKGKKGKGKAKLPPPRKDGMEVPAGHPFVSGSFLKKRILRLLASQRLIEKRWLPADPGSILLRGTSNADKLWAKWELSDADTTKARWNRLTSAPVTTRDLSEMGAEVAREREAEARAARQARFASGEETRTERDIWEWDERPKGITTPLERTHLNKRRSRARPAKEERRAAYETERAEAEEEARAAVAKEAGQH